MDLSLVVIIFLFNKKAQFVLAKSTGALTCLLGLLIISRASAQTTTVTGSMSVSTVISADSPAANPNGSTGSYCSISAGNMNFAGLHGFINYCNFSGVC